jgi:putative addiction module CopG family antidote
MTLTLAPDQERFVDEKIRSGQYSTQEDVLRAALETFMQHTRLEQLPMDQLEIIFPGIREKIAHGIAQADAGLLSDGDAFFDQLERDDVD